MKVQDVMTRNAAACRLHDPLTRAAELMWERDCGAVPVIEESGVLRGMITDRDVCMAAYTQGLPIHQIEVRSAMSRDLVSCRPEDSIETAQTLMQRNKVRRLPVSDGDRLVGMLSLSDLLIRYLPQARKDESMRPDMLLQTLAAVSTPNGGPPSERDSARTGPSRYGARASS